jgi:(2Fe-2S) ferredoxin
MQVCGTTPCRLNGAQNIMAALEKHLGIHLGQTTPCGTFTLGEMECMGACVNAPMVVVSDYSNGVEGYSYNYYEDLSPEDAVRIADTYKAGDLLLCEPCHPPRVTLRTAGAFKQVTELCFAQSLVYMAYVVANPGRKGIQVECNISGVRSHPVMLCMPKWMCLDLAPHRRSQKSAQGKRSPKWSIPNICSKV